MDADLMIKGMGLIVAWLGLLWPVWRWLTQRVDNKHKEAMEHVEKLHERVNEVRDLYVKRSDLDRDLKAVNSSLESIKQDLSRQSTEVTKRLDHLLLAVRDQNSSRS